jgi:hypothetical protein
VTNKTAPAAPERAANAARFRLHAAACFIAALLPLPDALALTLGRIQGTALIGRPLQLSLPVTVQSEEELKCVRAELQQAELLNTPLAWRLERSGDGAVLRLSSSQPVQEPVITVRVVVGCHDQFSQGYVLLADPPPQREVVPLVVAAPAPAALPLAQPAPAPRANARPARAQPPHSTSEAARPPARQRPAWPAAKAPLPAPREAAAEGRPRLQVDLLDIAIDQAPMLKATPQLAPPPANAMTRAEAVAAWQEINASPEQQLAAAREQSQAVQSEIKALREQTRRQSEQLQKLVDQRNLVRDILAGIAVAVAVGLALLLWRRSRETSAQRAWYQRSHPQAAAAPGDSSFVDSSFPEHAQESPRVAPEPDSGWVQAHVGTGGVRAAESGYGRSRMLPTAEELLDVQEKANFFLAVGQPEKAIELLESRLLEHLGASPFLWLDLLDLCRKLQRRDDYERVREEFQGTFAARLPHFEEAETGSGGLEHYPKALSRIELLWPSTRVMQEIEKSLFEERASGAIMFDLEASRELLLLYSIAMDVTSQEDGRLYTPTMVTPLQSEAGESTHTNTQPMPLMELDTQPPPPGAMVNLGLDLDFSALEKSAMLPKLDVGGPAGEPDAALDFDLDLDLAAPAAARVK